jgi:hypothetical protein
MTQKLQTKITDDNITPSERSENTGSDGSLFNSLIKSSSS